MIWSLPARTILSCYIGVGWRKATTDRISDPHFQVAIVGWMRDDGVVAVTLGVDDSNVVWVCDIH